MTEHMNHEKRAGELLGPYDISNEMWREYDFGGRVYRINAPNSVYFRERGTTHRVVDSEGVVHCVPAPGQGGCVLRWKNPEETNPVNW